ncbi:hypothetical protein NDU88_004712 [Pleurodeles waltl]|uniref:Uncharacterized protein n=1 Tax=Pleurodeles waltl TaxID=8319 RepID=A0AAV7UGA6_PLEWA|nr:hypothetical protein NDU88_004712 [Pleurodeles waltl]
MDDRGSAGAVSWVSAVLELRRSRQPALRVPLQGNASRASTSRAAEQAAACRAGSEQDGPGKRTSAGRSKRVSPSKAVRGSILDRGYIMDYLKSRFGSSSFPS